jgi:hypothetical protein
MPKRPWEDLEWLNLVEQVREITVVLRDALLSNSQ